MRCLLKFFQIISVSVLALPISCFVATNNAALAADADAPAPNRPIRDKWALVIGISDFDNPSLKLRYSAKDASDFAEYLKHEAGFAPDHVKILLNKDATQRRILSELGNKWLPHVANPDDLVVIFVSTHGSGSELDIGGQNYLIAYDTDINDLYTTGIPMQRLAHDIKARVHCDRVVIFLDACHSGATESGGKGLVRTGVDAGEFSAGSGQLVIASSKEDQISWESKKLENGVFTAVLLDALKKQGASTTIGQMFASLKDNVQDTVLRERGFLQTPVMKSQWSGNDILIAAKPTAPRPGLEEPDTTSVAEPEVPSAAPAPVSEETTTPIRRKIAITTSDKNKPSAPETDPINPRILLVPGKSVARIKLGMSSSELVQLLGKPTLSKGNVITYWTSDRRYFLSVLLNNSLITEIAFSSPAFKTDHEISLANYPANKSFFTSAKRGDDSVMTLHGGGLAIVSSKGTGSSSGSIGVVYSSTSTAPNANWWDVGSAPLPVRTASTTRSAEKRDDSNISTLVVPGVSLAKAKLGMTKSALIELLGKPTDEQGDHLTYWTKDAKIFLCINILNGTVNEIVFSSKAFVTSNGVGVSTFADPGHRDLFLPPKQDSRNSAQIYTLKQGGLSMAKLANGTEFGWLHAKSTQPSMLPWTPPLPKSPSAQ
jgi:hypothetical protein